MTELVKKINDKNETYMEYQGIVFTYSLMRGGQQEVKMGIVQGKE